MSNRQFATLKEEDVSIETNENIKEIHNNNNNNNNNKFYSYEVQEFIKTINLIYEVFTPCVKKYGKKILIYTITTILSFSTIFYYYRSLRGCSLPEQECMNTVGAPYFVERTFECINSAFCLSIIISFVINKLLNKVILIIFGVFYFINFCIFRGMDLRNHGSFNTLLYFIFCPIFLLINQFWFLAYRKIKEKKFLPLIIIITIIFLPFMYITYRVKTDCNDWGIGLGNKPIEYSNRKENACYIKKPEKCWKTLFNNKLDFSKLTFYKCKKKSSNFKKTLLKYKGNKYKNTVNFAYPITTQYSLSDSLFNEFITKNIEGMYDLDKATEEDFKKYGKPEVILHFNKDNSVNVEMKIEPNETLIKSRERLYKQSYHKFKNIVFIFFDALGREHFMRKMPKTTKILEKYYWDKTKSEETKKEKPKVTSYQFLKYQNFAGWTDINIFPMFYGVPYLTKGNHIINYYKKNGYITGQSVNFCSKELFPMYHWNIKYLKLENYDHEHFGLFCDPNYHYPEAPFSSIYGPYSIRRKCIYGDDSFNYVIRYGLEFLNAYKNEPKILKIGFNDPHESTGETVGYIDDSLSKFIENFIENYDESIMFIASDHGNSMPDFNYIIQSDDAEIERTMGSLFLIINNKARINWKSIEINEQRMITPYDIHSTLLDIINVFEMENYHSEKGLPLDQEIDGLERNCEFYYPDFYKDNKIREGCICLNYNK